MLKKPQRLPPRNSWLYSVFFSSSLRQNLPKRQQGHQEIQARNLVDGSLKRDIKDIFAFDPKYFQLSRSTSSSSIAFLAASMFVSCVSAPQREEEPKRVKDSRDTPQS